MSHHKEAGSEGTRLGVASGSLHTLRLLDAKYHQQVDSALAHGNNLAYVWYLS